MSSEADVPAGPDLAQGVPAEAIAEGGVVLGHAEGEAVMLTRLRGRVVAVGARCSHYGGPLDEGLIVDGAVRCPWHHAAFDLATGEVLRPPALLNLSCWRVEERDGLAYVVGRKETPAARSPAAASSGPESVVIVGAGAAGACAAETLRREGYDRPITLLEAGPSAPYDRPNLSKDYLAGSAPEEWIPLHPDGFYAEAGIDLILGATVAEIDPARRRVILADGSSRAYGALLIATGAEPIRLPIPDAAQPVRYLRTLADSRAIVAAATAARRAVVIGASFIGLEVAAALRARGVEVTVVAPEARPLEKVMGGEIGDFIRAVHEEQGVRFRLGRTVQSVGRHDVTLSDGEAVAADLVVAGVGVRPMTALAERAGLAADRGILVDEHLETSAPGIYAAGDLARWPDARLDERVRVEHWVVAQRQGQTAARNILAGRPDARERFAAVPFFWSRHYDVAINYVGHAPRWDAVVMAGDLAARDCSVEFRAGERTLAVATIGRDRASLEAEVALEHAGAAAP